MRIKTLGYLSLFLLLVVAPVRGETTGSYFAVIVANIETSERWYRSVLNLEVASRMSEADRYDIVNLRGPGLFVELLELTAAGSRATGLTEGHFKTGLLVRDLDKFIATLPATPDTPEIITDANNALRLVQLRDPDGNIVQVMELFASEKHAVQE